MAKACLAGISATGTKWQVGALIRGKTAHQTHMKPSEYHPNSEAAPTSESDIDEEVMKRQYGFMDYY